MVVSFRYGFELIFVTRLVEGCFLFLVYLMLLLSSLLKNQNRREPHLLKFAGIIGMIFISIHIALPTLVCSPPLTLLCYTIAFLIGLILYIPVLISLGILLFLFGKQNQEIYGRFLYISGALWMVTFIGDIFVLIVLSFDLWMLLFLGIVTFFAVPAFILMIVHGAKFNDTFFILAGVFYILSWLSSLLIPLFLTISL